MTVWSKSSRKVNETKSIKTFVFDVARGFRVSNETLSAEKQELDKKQEELELFTMTGAPSDGVDEENVPQSESTP